MIKILFVCHGNICRSPMAEFVMKNLVKEKGLSEDFQIDSAATSSEEIGNPVYPPVKRILSSHGIDCSKKRARQITPSDYKTYDYLIGMDSANIRNMKYIFGEDKEGKIFKLMDFSSGGDVADPWYTRDFDSTWQDVNIGCNALLKYISNRQLS